MGRLVENHASARTGGGYGRSRVYEVTDEGKKAKHPRGLTIMQRRGKQCMLCQQRLKTMAVATIMQRRGKQCVPLPTAA